MPEASRTVWRSAAFAFALSGAALPLAAQQAQSQAPAAPGSAGNDKVEIMTFDAWVVTCRAADARPRQCSAQARILQSVAANQPPRVVFSWIIGLDQGKPVGVFTMPTGVLIAPGVDMVIGKDVKRKLAFSQCVADGCEAVVPLDEGVIKAVQGNETLEATIVSVDRRQIKFALTLKGIDKALAEVRR